MRRMRAVTVGERREQSALEVPAAWRVSRWFERPCIGMAHYC